MSTFKLFTYVYLQHLYLLEYDSFPLSSKAPRKAAVKLEKSEEKSDVEKKIGEKPAAATASEEKVKKRYEYGNI